MKKKRYDNILKNIKKFRFNSVIFRNFLVVIVTEILMVGFLTNLYANQIEKRTADEIMDMYNTELQRSAETLDTVIDQMHNFAYYFSVENDMKLLFLSRNVEEESAVYKSVSGRMTSFRKTFDYVHSVYVYREDVGLVIKETAVTELEDITDTGWLAFYEEIGEKNYILRSRCADQNYPFLLTMLLAIRDAQSNVIGAVVIDIDVSKLNDAIGRSSKDEQKVYMVDTEGRLLYSSVPRAVKYPELIPGNLTAMSRNENGSVIIEEEGSELIVTIADSQTKHWDYIMYSSMASYNEQIAAVHRQMSKFGVLAVAVGMIVSYFMAFQSYRPIQHIMNEVENSEEIRDEFIEGDTVKNEVQYISQMIRNTKRRNKKLTMEVSDWMEKLGRAQLMALQSQINPHFLYNTLDSINWLAIDRLGKKNDVSTAMSSLARLLRLSLDRTSYLVPLREELEHAQLYMYLMNIRYSGKIKVLWEIPEQLYEEKVIRLCLQPILENSVRHGLREKRYHGTIRIDGSLVNDMLILRVQDDGKGLPVEECRSINKKLYSDYQQVDDHVGIANVNQRIKIVFGEDYGVVLRPGEEKGLTVILCFPAKKD